MGDPDADLISAGVGGLVSKKNEIENFALGLELPDPARNGVGGRLGVPLLAIGRDQFGLVGADRNRIPKLFFRLNRSQGENSDSSAVRFSEPNCFFDCAFLMGTDGEGEMASFDCASILGEVDASSGRGNSFYTNQDSHLKNSIAFGLLRGSPG